MAEYRPLPPLKPPVAVSEGRSRNMAAIRSVGNKTTELAMVRILRTLRLSGWRRHQAVAGRPDFVWPKQRVALFTDGCFWHGCPTCYKAPGRHRSYWNEKIKRNRLRDTTVTRNLEREGWRVVRIWECQIESQQAQARLIRSIRGKERRRDVREPAKL
jgi:DNA mismatch endonuclease (patch repair protein)